jgi:hypothetical protein
MKVTLGEDWESFFDICICNARKPLFFKSKASFSDVSKNLLMSFNSPKIKTGQELLDVEPTEMFKCKVF